MKKALNIGCGRRTIKSTIEMEWTNVDLYEREQKLDLVIDVTKEWKFEKNAYDYIYAEQFIEHLNWLEGKHFLKNCFEVLKKGGKLRLVLPHYRKIFQKYLEDDNEFFEVFFRGLNEGDLHYYSQVYLDPEKVLKERKDNPPPEWHTSPKREDRKRLKLRCRRFNYLIEIVDWFCHQFKEHKCLYDLESLSGILLDIGFSKVYEDKIQDIDSHAPTRITSSLYVEAIK